MLYIIVGILLFGLLIAVHEWGHFITAKLLGVKVNEFAIGMGPALVSFQKGETQYSLRLLPVGGYCAMEGEDETNDDPRAFSSKAPWRRLVILAAGSFMNFVAGFLLVALLFTAAGSYAVPVIREFAEGFSCAGADGLQAGDVHPAELPAGLSAPCGGSPLSHLQRAQTPVGDQTRAVQGLRQVRAELSHGGHLRAAPYALRH